MRWRGIITAKSGEIRGRSRSFVCNEVAGWEEEGGRTRPRRQREPRRGEGGAWATWANGGHAAGARAARRDVAGGRARLRLL